MKIRAKLSICGFVNMRPQEEKTVSDETAEKLIAAGYAEAVEEPEASAETPKKRTKKNEGK